MEARFVIFDLETGGPDAKRHPILQVAAIAIDESFEVLEAYEAKIRFEPKKVNASSLRKSSYHPGVWANEANEPRQVAYDFAAFLRRHATAPAMSSKGEAYRVAQLVAHNAVFDGPFLSNWYEQVGLFLPARRQVLCTLQLALWRFAMSGEHPPANFQLATLCAHFGVPFHAANAHDALGDAAATVQLLKAMLSGETQSGHRAA